MKLYNQSWDQGTAHFTREACPPHGPLRSLPCSRLTAVPSAWCRLRWFALQMDGLSRRCPLLASFMQHNFSCCILLMLLHFKLLCRISLWESHGLLAHCFGDGHLGWSPSLSCCHSVAKSCPLFVTPWSATRQASLSFTISQNFLKLMSIYSCPSPSLWVTANAHLWIPR